MYLEESKRRLLFYIADLINQIPSIRADTNILCTNRKEKKKTLLMTVILPFTF